MVSNRGYLDTKSQATDASMTSDDTGDTGISTRGKWRRVCYTSVRVSKGTDQLPLHTTLHIFKRLSVLWTTHTAKSATNMATPFPVSPARSRRNHTLSPSALSQLNASFGQDDSRRTHAMNRTSKTTTGGNTSTRDDTEVEDTRKGKRPSEKATSQETIRTKQWVSRWNVT